MDVIKKLPKDFCKRVFNECVNNINKTQSFNLIGLPGVGISFYLRYLSANINAHFIHINTYEMPEFTKDELLKQFSRKISPKSSGSNYLVQSREGLEELSKKHERIVIIINRLDRLSKLVDQNLFDNLKFLQDASPSKIVFVLVSSKPISELNPNIAHNTFLAQLKQLFFGTYSTNDLRAISKIDGTNKINERALELSGGHHSLFQTLLRCQSIENPLSDQMVELVVKELVSSQNAKRRDQMQSLALGKTVNNLEYLQDIGLVKKTSRKNEFFSNLILQFLTHASNSSLPSKERKLFKLLLRNCGKIVTKQNIFDYIWGDEIASEWSLNSLVYRLRRNPAFDSNRYTIKSVKKDGYMLIDSLKN